MELVITSIARWVHFVAGILWIGHLYFFNLVNFPYTKQTKPEERPQHIPKLMPLALAYFRYGALITVLVGFILIYFEHWRNSGLFGTLGAKTITFGGLLGLIMFFNVWVFIWPNQKKIINATKKGEKPDPKWTQTALRFSRINFVLSFPMLLFMAAASHFPMDWGGIALHTVIAAAIGFIFLRLAQR
ncbi:MAG: urate hydroxylase PuuD [bacterium]|nr:urate hydroxylase PuuD [bacterium]